MKLNFFELDEISGREFNFSIFIIMMCITFKNYFKHYEFEIPLKSDLFFDITLLLLPVTLLFFNKMKNEEIVNLYKTNVAIIIVFLGGMLYIILGSTLLYIANFITLINIFFILFGLIFLIAGIINVLISILVFVTVRKYKQEHMK